jgi:hypothetical protein
MHPQHGHNFFSINTFNDLEIKIIFTVPFSGSDFKNLWIFSMSSYIGNLINKEKSVTEIEANMPAVDARIKWLNSVYK